MIRMNIFSPKLYPISMLIREIFFLDFPHSVCTYENVHVRDKALWGIGKSGLIGLLEILLSFVKLLTKVNHDWPQNSELKGPALLTWKKIKTTLFLLSRH